LNRKRPPPIPEGIDKEEQENLEVQGWKIRKGNEGAVILIGEFFIHRLIPEKVMHFCINKLLQTDESGNYDLLDLESLCKLLTTIGEYLDLGKRKDWMDQYFETLKVITKIESIPKRNRFIVQDVIDLRFKLKWVPRRQKGKPKKNEGCFRTLCNGR
jgi:translation initiation factor 4G